jgi:hypothetical protein
MGKSNAAKVIDLEAFRRRKMRSGGGRSPLLLVPVWFCWIPMWVVG